jgi:multidrug efflux pump subunit AcrA (membrane-fusion protein)
LRTVRTGDRQDDLVEIVAGLTPGEQVVVHPAATLADGTRVRASAAPATGAGR